MANPSHAAQKKQVEDVLADLGVIDPETGSSAIPILEVWNKCDLLDAESLVELQASVSGQAAVMVSAATGKGVDALVAELGRLLTGGAQLHRFDIGASDGARLAWLHAYGEVLSITEVTGKGAEPLRRVEVRLTPRELGRFSALSG
jgi:GTP-binding protein HflX